jgi:hypothetical protein
LCCNLGDLVLFCKRLLNMKQDPATTPAGYAPTALPFYTELDDSGFEQFCTDLLNLHPRIFCLREGQVTTRQIVTANRLLSGTPQKGADIRAEAERGEVWFFQCKHTKDFGPADVTEAVDLAEKSLPQADQFVLVTTRGLSEEAQRRLHERKKWLLWDASNLTTEVLKLRPREEAINLVHRFFGPEWKKALFSSSDQPLLSWKEFFSQDLSSDRQHFHHRIPYVPWSDALARLESFAHSGAGRALVLSAGGGQGKSRLLLELAQNLEKQANAPRVRFLNLNRRGLAPEQSDFLAREEGDLLVIIDDAHRLDAAIQDVARATASTKTIRLLIATRPQALEAVTSHLFQCGYAQRLETPLCLPRWKSEEIHGLAERILGPQYQSHASRLADLADRCPLLVVMGGTLINSGIWPETMTSEEAFRERVFRSFKEDLLNRQPENHRVGLDRLIKLLSFVSPTPKNEKLLDKAAEILGCSALDVAEGLDRLQAAGMAVENREGIRLYPDLFADAVLLDASLDHSGQASALCRVILQKLPSSDFPTLMRNIAQADWETRTKRGVNASLFDPVWKEFIRRFEAGVWVDSYTVFAGRVLEEYTEGRSKVQPCDRAELLSQWASFAVYLPEKTLELAEIALKTTELPTRATTNDAQTKAPAFASSALPPLLKPIVIWHPEFTNRALDFLWSLDADEPKGNWQNSSNAIAAIADAGSFDVYRPIAVAKTVLEWLERKTQEPATVERFRKQPWILSALLKPFFGREVEHTWSTGRTIHLSSLFVSAEKTRPLRQKALAVTKRFLESRDIQLSNAVIPLIKEAIHPIYGRFGSQASKQYHEAWQPDRLEVVKIIESATDCHRDAPILLLQLRRILQGRCEYDSDEIVRGECQRVLARMPDTFEFRVARVLTSYAHDEIRPRPGPNFESDLKAAEKNWTEFRCSVAHETTQRFQTASLVCEFVRHQMHELAATNSPVLGGALLESIAEISPEWCATLLEELLTATDETLDGFLWSVIHLASLKAPNCYQGAIESLPVSGRWEQLRSLISYFGWKHLHGGGLTESERRAVLKSTQRTEEFVVWTLASVAGLHFNNDPQWAMKILIQLKPCGERDAAEILEALARLIKGRYSELKRDEIAQCLENIGEHCFPKTISHEHDLGSIAERFPKQVYEHVRRLHGRAEADPAGRHPRGFTETLPLGKFEDQNYVDAEIHCLWQDAVSADSASFSQTYRLALIRSLLWSDTASVANGIQKLVGQCKSGDELKLAARIAATPGSRFVFQFPNLVRLLLVASDNLGFRSAVQETLVISALGGGRSYTNHEVDPEFRYIMEEGEGLANRHRDDPVLGPFYRLIADSERKSLEWNKRIYPNDDLD